MTPMTRMGVTFLDPGVGYAILLHENQKISKLLFTRVVFAPCFFLCGACGASEDGAFQNIYKN